MKEKVWKRKQFWLACLLFLLLALQYLLGCPIYQLFGVHCPGCGLTRAWLHFLQGNWREAFHQHLLFLPTPLFILLFARRDALSERMRVHADLALYAFGVLTFTYYAYRVYRIY